MNQREFELHSVMALACEPLGVCTGVLAAGVRPEIEFEGHVASDFHVCLACEDDLLADSAQMYGVLCRMGEASQSLFVSATESVCLFHQLPYLLRVCFVSASGFEGQRFEISMGRQLRLRLNGASDGYRLRPRKDGTNLEERTARLAKLLDSAAIGFRTGIAKLRRGEWFHAIYRLSLLRSMFVRTLLQTGYGIPERELYRFETIAPSWSEWIAAMVPASYSREAVAAALRGALDAFCRLAERGGTLLREHAFFTLVPVFHHWLDEGVPGESRFQQTARKQAGDLLRRIVQQAQHDSAVIGVAVGGSWLGSRCSGETGDFDELSDLNVYVAVAESPTQPWCTAFVSALGDIRALQVSRTCYVMGLIGPELQKVDFRFVQPEDLHRRWETPEICWEAESCLSLVFCASRASPIFNEERQRSVFWLDTMWPMMLVSTRRAVAEGRLLQALDNVEWSRTHVLGVLAALAENLPSRGVRRLEFRFPKATRLLADSVQRWDANGLELALESMDAAFAALRAQLSAPPPGPQPGLFSFGEGQRPFERACQT